MLCEAQHRWGWTCASRGKLNRNFKVAIFLLEFLLPVANVVHAVLIGEL